jgi:hypothetical protein
MGYDVCLCISRMPHATHRSLSICRILRRHVRPNILLTSTIRIVSIILPPLTFTPTFPLSDPNERAHFWLPDSEATTTHELLDSPTASRMYMDQNEIVRIRVEADEFYDDEPGPPKAAEGVQIRRDQGRAPFSIIVSIALFFVLACGRRMI